MKWVGSLAAIIIALVVGGTGYNLWSRTKEVIRRSSDVETVQSNLTTRAAEITNMYVAAVERHRELTNRIRELSVLDNLVTAQQLQKASERIDALTAQAEGALLATTILSAHSGDALAYDRLVFWSTNDTRPISLQAKQAIEELVFSETGAFAARYEKRVITTWDLSLGFDNALNNYRSSLPEARISVIETIGTATNYSKAQRIGFLFRAATTDSTIAGRRFAIDLLNKELKTEFWILRPADIVEWWRTNSLNGVFKEK